MDVRRQLPSLQIGRNGFEVVCRRERPVRLSQSQETVIAQVIVDIGNQHMEDDTPIEDMGVRLTLGAVFSKGIDDLRRAAALAAHRRHRRQERGADRPFAIEASRQHDGLAGEVDQLVPRSGDTCLAGQPQRDLFPALHAVVVGLLREFRD